MKKQVPTQGQLVKFLAQETHKFMLEYSKEGKQPTEVMMGCFLAGLFLDNGLRLVKEGDDFMYRGE